MRKIAVLVMALAVVSALAETNDSSCVFGRVDEFPALQAREPRFEKAAAFLARKDLATLAVGRYEIDGDDVFALVQECKLRDKASDPQPEAHRAYIDIQVPLSGEETYGYGWLTEKNYTKSFDRKKDFGLYREQPLQWRTLKPGEFAVFFPPYGAHAPSCRDGGPERTLRKLVIKVRKTGETLYNGIELPGVWPPKIDLANRGAMEVPYLEEANIPKVIPIDLGRQLFVDDFLIASMDGTTRVYGKPVKYEGNPLLKPETEIEIHRPGNSVALPKGGGMWWDADRQVFRLWYETGWCYRIAYAESKDGLAWTRPNLDIVPGTNRLLPDLKVDSWSVIYDPDTADPNVRWKLMNSRGAHMREMDIFVSADGIHWQSRGTAGRAGDRTTMFYNPFRKVWVYSLRGSGPWPGGFGGRNRGYFETRDFERGSKWTWYEDGSDRNPVQWMQADSTDVTYEDPNLNKKPSLYNFDAVAYESLMVGFREIHHGPENNVCSQKGLPKITDLVFAYSRDGFHFSCPDRTPAIASERWEAYGKKWDVGYVQPLGNICVIKGDELWFYYGAFGGDTSRLEPDRNNNCYYNGMYDHGAMGLATMRRDGFVGLRGGVVTTRPVRYSGRSLFVNLAGELGVEVLDEKGALLKRLADVKGDKTLLRVDDVSAFAGRPVRFRFTLKGESTLYSFWVSRTDRGESAGYLAGGGPGYRGIRDLSAPEGKAAVPKVPPMPYSALPAPSCAETVSVPGEAPSLLPANRKFRLAWHDEFSGDRLDERKWGYRVNFWDLENMWFARPDEGAVEVSDGTVKLKLIRRADGSFASPQLQSGSLSYECHRAKRKPEDEGKRRGFWPFGRISKPKFAHKYGYWECRCKLQQKPGWWSAFWLQAPAIGMTTDARQSGVECDVMESFSPGTVVSHMLHYAGYGSQHERMCAYPGRRNGVIQMDKTVFHTFGVLWERDGYTFYIDGRQSGEKVTKMVSDTEQFILISTECQSYRSNGTWAKALEKSMPDCFEVDYVRVYDEIR